jgi:FkbM family methyltransferase
MAKSLAAAAKRWRDNYYFSLLLSTTAKPVYSMCRAVAHRIQAHIKRNGVSLRLPGGEVIRLAPNAGINFASHLFWHGLDGYEPETTQTMRFFAERSTTLIDVGANCGLYSILGALWNPRMRVVAFEPVPEIYEGLVRNIALNGLQGRVVCENLALSSKSGEGTLYLPEAEGRDPETTGTLNTQSWQVRKGARPVQVQTARFDDYESHHPMRVDVIKIDVEDFEADVLLGMERVLGRDKPFVICEILARNREHKNERTREIIQSLGYTPYWITPAGYILVSRFDFERKFSNFVLSPVSTPEEVLHSPSRLWELSGRQSASEDGLRAS